MGPIGRSPKRRKRSRRAGECVVQAFGIASQMALLYPAGVDEWLRLEVGDRPDGMPRRGPRKP